MDKKDYNAFVTSVKITRAKQTARVLWGAAEKEQTRSSKPALTKGRSKTVYVTLFCQANGIFTAAKRTFAMANISLVRTFTC